MILRLGVLFICLGVGPSLLAAELTPAERGKKALLEKSYIPPAWSLSAYDNVWKLWGVKEKPANYPAAFRERYGLHPAPYANDQLPMGLRKDSVFLFQGLAVDCMVCHGGSIFGKSYVGLGNSTLDVHALFEEMTQADGVKVGLPFRFSNVRGTNEAGAMGVYLLGFRDPDLKLQRPRKELGLHDDLCEDVPAWWLLKKKQTMYYTGGADARSVRSKMQFMMTPLNPPEAFHKHEAAFKDIQEYLLSLEAPKYPLPIDSKLAHQGETIFREHCASCHGTYGEKPTYPNKIVPLDKVGTDRRRFDGITDAYGQYYNTTWFAKEESGWFFQGKVARASLGYQAPPLDGIWATAPYLHNGSVPTLYQVLKSETRPKLYTRSFRTNEEDYDPKWVGWKVQEFKQIDPSIRSPFEKRKIYDTREPGRGNQGHTFGDALTEDERLALIEYLKTL